MNMRTKHPKTPHLPWSETVQTDDEHITSLTPFVGREVVVTEKRDGECTSLYPDGFVHARSTTGSSHPWQTPIKRMWAEHAHELPEGWRVVGENLHAQHSIAYTNLSDWLEVFAIFDQNNTALSWEDTTEIAGMLQLRTVPVLWTGTWNEQTIRGLSNTINTATTEGLVVRVSGSFRHDQWGEYVAKWVRAGHVQTSERWAAQWQPNTLA